MTNVEVTGEVVPRFSRRDAGAFTRQVLLALEKLNRVPEELSEVTIAFVTDVTMLDLNKRFRKKSRTTDVLTFPADDSYNDPSQKGRPLGDIVISVDQARRQAAQEKHSTATEIRYLILHGVLHALGYDHETDEGEMNELEVEVRAIVGLG